LFVFVVFQQSNVFWYWILFDVTLSCTDWWNVLKVWIKERGLRGYRENEVLNHLSIFYLSDVPVLISTETETVLNFRNFCSCSSKNICTLELTPTTPNIIFFSVHHTLSCNCNVTCPKLRRMRFVFVRQH